MKKISALALALIFCLLCFAACGAKIKIDGKSFDFTYAHVKGQVRACSTAYAERYEGVKTADYSLSASGGKLTVTGAEGTFTGEYRVEKLLESSVLYEISIGEEAGFASLSEKMLEDGTVEYTLVLTIKGYYVNFVSK